MSSFDVDEFINLSQGKFELPNMFSKGIGELIRAAREERGFTQKELADLVSKSQVTISDIENGKTDISFYTMIALAIKLGKPIASFLPDSVARRVLAETQSKQEQEFLQTFQYIDDRDLRDVAIKILDVLANQDLIIRENIEQGFDPRELDDN